MSVDTTFQPLGNTSLVNAAAGAVQILPYAGTHIPTVRVRCTTAGYLAWGSKASLAAAAVPAGAGNLGAVNTLGFATGQTEKLDIPAGMFFTSDAAGVFELTPGIGGN